jgi:phage terminase small subunit
MSDTPQVVKLFNGNRLTFKRKQFAKEYVKNGGNGTQAALKVYDTKSPNVANNIASENLQVPIVAQTIEELASSVGVNSNGILKNINRLAVQEPEKVTADTVLKANIELAKILRMYPDKKSTHVRLDVKAKFKEMDFNQAKKTYESLQGEIQELTTEPEG